MERSKISSAEKQRRSTATRTMTSKGGVCFFLCLSLDLSSAGPFSGRSRVR